MTRPSVLQIIPELSAGGAERTTLEIADALKRAGGRALIVSEGGRLEDDLKALGGELIKLPVKSKSPLTMRKNAARLSEIIQREKVDIIHARSRAPAWSALWAARRTNTPFITTYHGHYNAKTKLKKLYNSVMVRGDVVIANSEFTAQHIREEYGIAADKLITIHRGVDTEAFSPARLDEAKVLDLRQNLAGKAETLIILPGRLTDWKGQGVLIEALGQIDKALLKSLHVQLVGDAQGRNDYVEALNLNISKYGLDDFVTISGHYSDMPTLLSAADLIIAPSKRPEAFGRIAIEAGAMARPVIVSDHGGQRETVRNGETGWHVAPGDASALTEAIKRFLAKPKSDRKSMGDKARAFVEDRFTTKRLQEKTLAVYARLLQRQGTHG